MKKNTQFAFWLLLLSMAFEQKGIAFQNCPEPESFYSTIRAAYDLMGSDNATEKELQTSLRELMDGPVNRSLLIRTWSKIDKFYNGYANAPSEIRRVSTRLGDMNLSTGCIQLYNEWAERKNSNGSNEPVDPPAIKPEVVTVHDTIYVDRDCPPMWGDDIESANRQSDTQLSWLIVLLIILQAVMIFQLSRVTLTNKK